MNKQKLITGDTITLEKGTYTLEKTLVIDKELTVVAAANCEWGDVLITAAAPTDSVPPPPLFGSHSFVRVPWLILCIP